MTEDVDAEQNSAASIRGKTRPDGLCDNSRGGFALNDVS